MLLGELFKKLGLGKRHLFFALLSIFVTFFTISIWAYELNRQPQETRAAAATCYWVGDTNPANWNDASHWDASSGGAGGDCDGGVVPGSDDTAVFDNANSNSVNVDAAINVAAITNTNYAGTFTTNGNSVTVSGDVSFKSGTLNLGTNTWTLSGNLDFRSGTIQASTSTIIMNGATKVINGGQQTLNNIQFSGNTSIGAGENNDTKNFYVNGTMTIDSGKTLTFTYRTNIYMNKGSTTSLSGIIAEGSANQTLHLIDDAGANLSTGGTINVVASFETATENVTIPARTYDGGIAVVNASASDYVATMGTAGSQTITSTGNHNFTMSANGDGDITLDAATYDPTFNIYATGDSTKGNLDFTGTGGGSEIINAGDGTWTIDGTIDFTGGTFNPNNSTVYSRVKGAQNPNITSNGSSFHNFTINNPDTAGRTFTFVDSVTVIDTLTMTAVLNAFTVKFTAGTTCTANVIDIDGASGKLITLKSVTDTSQWYFNVAQAVPAVSYVSARDSNADGGSDIRATNSTNVSGNSSWLFLTSTTISGTVYTAESKATNIGAAKTIGISVQGAPISTVESGAGGTFSFSVPAAAGDAITIFEDNEGAEEMTLVTQAPTPLANVTGLEAYTSKVVLTHASAGPMTNTIMAYADSTLDDDIKYTMSGSNVDFTDDFEMWVEASKTYTPGGAVDVDDVDINGTFSMGANAVTVHGNWDATGGGYTSTSTVTFDGSTAQTLTSDGDSFYNLTISNTHASGVILADALSLSANLNLNAAGASNVLLDAATSNPAVNITGNIDYIGVGAGTEDIHMGTNNWTVSGNIDLSGGTINSGTSTLILNGTTSLTSGSQVFYNVQLGTAGLGGSLTLLDAADFGAEFTILNGAATTLVLTNQTLTLAGNIAFSNLDNFTYTNSTVVLDAADVGNTITLATKHLNNLTFNNALGGWSFADAVNLDGSLTITNSEAAGNGVNFNNQIVDVNGNLQIDAGKLTMGSTTLTLAGHWIGNGGTVVANTSTVELNGGALQTVTSGTQSFHNLTISNSSVAGVAFADSATVADTFTNITSDSKVTFAAGSTFAFNSVNIAGTAGHLVNFVSGTPGVSWLLNITDAAPTANYVSATDCNASGGSAVNAQTGGFNGGGNSNWIFAVANITVTPLSVTLDQATSQTFTATAKDAEGYNVPTATFTWSVIAGGGTITPLGVFTAGTVAGTYTNTIQATSGAANGTASVVVSAAPTPEPTPTDGSCVLGPITSVAIQDSSFSLNAGGTKTLGVSFYDASGNAVHKDSVTNFRINPDFGDSWWNISKGGGRLADENQNTININFVAGGTRGSFDNTIAFSACGGTLKAYSTPTIIKQKTIYADMEPESYALQSGEGFTFHVSLFDDIQVPVEETCSYSWSVSDPAGAKIDSPASASTKVTGSAVGEYTLKVDASCASGVASATSALAVVKIDENTEWQLTNYFPSISTWEGQKTYIGFIPQIKVNNRWYSRAETLDYKMSDPAAAKVAGLHQNYPNIPIVEALKVGCYPFQVQATLNKFGKSYFASTSMNIGLSDKSSYYNQFQPTLGDSTLSYQHMKKIAGEVRLNLNRNNTAGQSYSNYNWIYVGKPMNTTWIVNDTRIGSIRPYYNASYLDTTNAEYGYFPNAVTTVVDFNGKKKTENWDIWIERNSDKVTFSPSVPDTIRVKPNSLFRGVWQGYKYASWNERIDNTYKIKSLDANAVTLVNGGDINILFKSGSKEGTYKDAIVVGSAYSTSSMSGGEERKITVVIDNSITADLCSASAFAQVSSNDKSVGPGEQTADKDKNNKGISDILRDLWNAIVEAIKAALNWLNNNPLASLLISFLLTLPTLLTIIGTSVIGNTLGSISKAFSIFSVGAISGKKNRRLGYIYDYVTKKPIKGARVTAYATQTGRAIYQTITNSLGEFTLFLPQGEYYLKVEKKGYKPYQIVPTENQQHFNGKRTDGYYEAIYLPSETLNITSGQADFAHAIAIPLMRPMTQENKFTAFLVKLGGWILKASFYFLIFGTLITVGLIIYDSSNLLNILIGIYYALVWFLYGYKHFTFFSGTASVSDEGGRALDLALVRVLNQKGKLIQTVVSDRKGKFMLNIAKGEYWITIAKAEYQIKKINLKVKSLSDINQMKIKLEKTQSANSVE